MAEEAKEISNAGLKSESESVVDKALGLLDEGAEKKTTVEETSTSEGTVKDETKTEEASEDKTSLKNEEAKEKETEIPKEFHKHPAWQRIMKERDEARKVLEETQKTLPKKEELEMFNKTTSSPEYIRASMEAQGYTDEAVNKKLKELGHEVADTGVTLHEQIVKELGINPKQFASQEEYERSTAVVADIVAISQKVAEKIISQRLGKEIAPLKTTLEKFEHRESANQYVADMKKSVADEGILEWKEIEPGLAEFLDKNKEATQEDVLDFFKDLKHQLTIERLKTKEKKADRDDKRGDLRGNRPGLPAKAGGFRAIKPGEDVNKFLDEQLDAAGIRN